ncbi:MAG: NAD-glutamate dehydrogenase, partial [Steroidobacteraceae bacterium]
RLHIVVRTDPAARPARSARHRIDVAGLERAITEATATWADRLRVELATQMDEAAALAAARRFLDMLPATYVDDVDPRAALADIAEITALERDPEEPRVRLLEAGSERRTSPPQRPAPPQQLHLKVLEVGEPIPVSDILPMMENFGLRLIAERPYELAWPAGGTAWIQDFELEHRGARLDLERVEPLFREAFLAVWRGEVENDGFNRLLLGAGLAAREIAVLRAYCRYLLQAGIPFSQAYMERVLASNAGIARNLLRLFALGLDPRPASRLARRPSARPAALQRATAQPAADLPRRCEQLAAGIRRALDSVTSLDEDRILRAYLNAVTATLRTNFYQSRPDGRPKPYLALKLDPQRLPELPLPRPKFEVFVYSPRVEAVHLRMAGVARGGIRWSDRREDFRTEILGLMKAQNVKNTVIVPMGAKGGFVVKCPPAGGAAELQREVVACYRTFMQGLLDLTDNIAGRKIVRPPQVACLDGPDPYLVVAADKGTAAFSDVANGISAAYRFWLGDAFASGGSAGYDHKKMGITARGAWECVKRHFRELGVDIGRTDFSVAGIGDMSGDVFGNGMLLSRHILLKAAFNHQHVFLDPAPDARLAFAERARLFALPRSTWDDYDRRRISRGGGVFARSAKSIPLSREAQSLLALPAPAATPEQVIRAILVMPADLLWNGGIGTYVKASPESHLDVGDRANDAVRVNGSALRAKVVGEGGNLGLSQRGRIEYALKGGRLNTDFIDNSAGVNTSDVEVNIKILLNPEVEAGRLRHADRDRLLARMTPEVAALVLRNNYLQGQALSMLESQSVARLAEYRHLIRLLERSASLDRALEFLPDDDELEARRQRGVGLTRPELAVVLAYSKIWLSHHLLASDVPEDPYLKQELERYFPPPLRRRFAAAIRRHRLRREIIVTATANSLVNRMGPAFVLRAADDTGAEPARIARAYTAAREIFDARTLWAAIEALDGRLDAAVQYAMMIETSRLLRHASYRLLAARHELSIERAVADLRGGVRELQAHIEGSLRGLWRERFEAARRNYIAAGVPADLAARVASLDALNAAPDIVEIAGARGSVQDAARVYFEIGARIGIDWLHDRVERLPVEGAWQAVARTELRHGVERTHRRIAERVLSTRRGGRPAATVAAWLEGAREKLGNLERRLADMRAGGAADFATLSVALQSVHALCD